MNNNYNIMLTFLVFIILLSPINSESYCVIDKESNIIISHNPYKTRPPASTIKLLTAMVVLDNVEENKYFVVSKRASRAPKVKLYLKPGEKIKCYDLLKAILLKSANDAAVVLAEGTAGSVEKFVELMNRKAKTIGCVHTNLKTPNGLPSEGQYSCAYDIALIALRSYDYPLIRRILKLRKAKFYSILKNGKKRRYEIYSLNRVINRDIYGKTGYTNKARHTFAGIINLYGRLMAFSIMGVPKRSLLWKRIIKLENKMKIETIKFIQRKLKKLNYYEGKIDGIYGPKTKKAVKLFQRDYNLSIDGIVGEYTWRKLIKVRIKD